MKPTEAHALNEQVQRAYNVVFSTPDGKAVLADLIAFCHGRKTTFDPNDRVHAFNDGKREVLMRIAEFVNLPLDEIYRLRGNFRRASTPQDGDD